MKVKNQLEGLKIESLIELVDEEDGLSYSKLCDKIGIKKKGGKAKETQLKQLGSICEFVITRNPTRFQIIAIYEDIVSEEQFKKTAGKFSSDLEEVLLLYLSKNQNFCTTKGKLLQILGMVNKNFTFLRNTKARKRIATELGYQQEDLVVFSDAAYSMLTRLVQNFLEGLQARSVIDMRKMYGFKQGKDFGWCAPNSLMGQEFMNIEHDVKKELGIETEYLTPTEAENYYKKCNEIAKEREGVEFFFVGIGITSTVHIIQEKLKDLKTSVNKKSVEKLEKSSDKRLKSLRNVDRKGMINNFISLEPDADCEQYFKNDESFA